MNIQKLCSYLDEIGILDKKSINKFLSIFSLVITKKNNYLNNNNNINATWNNKAISIYITTLSVYLDQLLSVKDNFKIFSHKIITKFSKTLIKKQKKSLYNLNFILYNKFNISKFNSFYKIYNYNKYNNNNNHTYNNEYQNNYYYYENSRNNKNTENYNNNMNINNNIINNVY